MNPNKIAIGISPGNNNVIAILAVTLVSQPPQVNMGYGSNTVRLPYNQVGISTVLDPTTGTISGDSYSAAAAPQGLGNSVTWGSQVFNIGPAGVNNILEVNGAGWLSLPEGNFNSLELLARPHRGITNRCSSTFGTSAAPTTRSRKASATG